MEYEVIASIGTVLISVGISYGIIAQKVKQLEHRMEVYEKDHDILVELNTKIDMLLNKTYKVQK